MVIVGVDIVHAVDLFLVTEFSVTSTTSEAVDSGYCSCYATDNIDYRPNKLK